MGIWKININRNYCVIAYAMPTHSVHSPIPVKGIPEPPLVIAWIARYFFALAQRKETLMGKVQILAVLTMDGCQSSELYCKAYKELRLEDCGINEIRENALYHITPDYSISMLDEWRKSATDICYLAEVTPEKADYINGLLRMRVVDEIILYTLPFIAGTGKRFFQSALPQEQWTLTSQKEWSAISIKRAFDVRKMDECSGNEHFKSKIIPDRQINCKIITLKSSTLQRVCRIFYFMNTLFANHIHVRIPKNRV